MKKLYIIPAIIVLMSLLSSYNLKANNSDTLKIIQNNGDLSLVILKNIDQATALNELDLKSIIEGIEKNKNNADDQSVVVSGKASNFIISKKGDLYYLSTLAAKTKENVFSVRIYENTTREQLQAFKEAASKVGIDVKYTNVSIVNGEIDAISMEVDCKDGISGNLSVTDIPKEGIGFVRDFSENSKKPFVIGNVFSSKELNSNDEDEDEDFSIAFNKASTIKKEETSKIKHNHEIEFMLGLNNYLTPNNQLPSNDDEVYSLEPISSWTYQINSVHEVKFSSFFQTNFMFGLQWYNFALENQDYQITKGAQGIEFDNTAISRPDISPRRSKLNITYLNAGIVPLVHFGESSSSLRVGAGIYGGYRIGSKSKFKYDDKGKDVEKTSFYLNPWHYGVRAQIGWKGVDLFATYDLNPLFNKNRGPELNAFSFGIIL